jgi:phage baseplate assembly protein W
LKTLKLVDGDLSFEKNDFQIVNEDAEIAQCAEIILGTNKNEWFLNPEFGIDFNSLIGKVTDAQIENEIIEGLSQEPRIESVENVSITRNKATRKVTITFEATLINGEVLESEVEIVAG